MHASCPLNPSHHSAASSRVGAHRGTRCALTVVEGTTSNARASLAHASRVPYAATWVVCVHRAFHVGEWTGSFTSSISRGCCLLPPGASRSTPPIPTFKATKGERTEPSTMTRRVRGISIRRIRVACNRHAVPLAMPALPALQKGSGGSGLSASSG